MPIKFFYTINLRDMLARDAIVVWAFTVVVPLTYTGLLPLLATMDPFGTGTYASVSNSTSISGYLNTPPANGGFALFVTPAIVYVISNPIARRSRVATAGGFALAVGFALVILFPLDFASTAVHNVGAGMTFVGYFVVVVAMTLSVKIELWLVLVLAFVIGINAFVATVYDDSTLAFLIFEYINLSFALVYTPLLNTFATRGRCIYFDRASGVLRLTCCGLTSPTFAPDIAM